MLPNAVAHTFNPSIMEAEAGRSLGLQGQPGLWSKLQDSQGYNKKPCQKINKKQEPTAYLPTRPGIPNTIKTYESHS